ncbi:MAG TPA: hypothetical protein PLD47_13805 [Aggregatilineales bacterium]|nr:hypothetical protein [Anaerolineales bacterium]HRE48796.1 hypothetical protein [Aggregatilineales bacterium]
MTNAPIITNFAQARAFCGTLTQPVVFFQPRFRLNMPDMIFLAEALAERFLPVFLYETETEWRECLIEVYPALHLWRFLGVGDASNVASAEKQPENTGEAPANTTGGRSLYRRVRGVGRQLIAPVTLFQWLIQNTRQKLHLYREVVSLFKPRGAFLNSDQDGDIYFTTELHRQGVPMIIPPRATANSYQEGKLEMAINRPRYTHHSRLFQEFTALIFPHTVKRFETRPIFRTHPLDIWVQWGFGIQPRSPWYMGGGKANYLLLPSPRDQARYEGYGVPRERLIVTGERTDDRLFEALKEQPLSTARSDGRPLLLWYVPPLPEHGYALTWDEHRRILTEVGLALKETSAEVRACLHPSHGQAWYRALCAELSIPIEERPLLEAIPEGKLFVSWYTNTLQWALRCAIPVVMMSMYDTLLPPQIERWANYYWGSQPELIRTFTAPDLQAEVERLLHDRDYFAHIKETLAPYSQDDSYFDGCSSQRLKGTVLRLLSA